MSEREKGEPSPAPSVTVVLRCEVTGKFVKPEDSIEFQGKTVSEEGKQVLLRKLLGCYEEPPARELPRPSFWRRFIYCVLDSIILSVLMAGINYAVFGFGPSRILSPEHTPEDILAGICGGVVYFLYYYHMQAAYGQTLGKMVGRFRVVNMNGTPIDGGTSLSRAFWSDGYIVPLLAFVYWKPELYGAFSVIVLLYTLANCLALVSDGQYNRALHDRLAGTRTVMDA